MLEMALGAIQFSGRLAHIPRTGIMVRWFATTPGASDDEQAIAEANEFRTLDLNPVKKERKRFEATNRRLSLDMMPPRSNRMHIDQDWSDVWPAASSFKPSAVPLPVRMGRPVNKRSAAPDKFGNAELMKIPNFLHLTPGAITKHCAALKKFCTAWPEGLATDRDCVDNFPVEIITSDYCNSGTTIRNTRARIVSLRIPLSKFNFDYHAKDKFLRLIGDRYDPDTDIVTIITDRCPTRKQNYEYAKYLLTALYFESWRTESWEHEKSEMDMEKFFFAGSVAERESKKLIDKIAEVQEKQGASSIASPGNDPKKQAIIDDYRKAVSELINDGEDLDSIEKYKATVKRLVGLTA